MGLCQIGVVSFERLTRQLITRVFAADERFTVAGEFSAGSEILRHVQSCKLNVLLMDVVSNGMAEMPILQSLQQIKPQLPILLLSSPSAGPFVVDLFERGIHGMVSKESNLDILLHASLTVAQGGIYYDKRLSSRSQTVQPGEVDLSHRERQVLELIASGYSTKETAALLQLSIKTVDNHRTHLMKKIGVHDVVKLTHFAIRSGMISVDSSSFARAQ